MNKLLIYIFAFLLQSNKSVSKSNSYKLLSLQPLTPLPNDEHISKMTAAYYARGLKQPENGDCALLR